MIVNCDPIAVAVVIDTAELFRKVRTLSAAIVKIASPETSPIETKAATGVDAFTVPFTAMAIWALKPTVILML